MRVFNPTIFKVLKVFENTFTNAIFLCACFFTPWYLLNLSLPPTYPELQEALISLYSPFQLKEKENVDRRNQPYTSLVKAACSLSRPTTS